MCFWFFFYKNLIDLKTSHEVLILFVHTLVYTKLQWVSLWTCHGVACICIFLFAMWICQVLKNIPYARTLVKFCVLGTLIMMLQCQKVMPAFKELRYGHFFPCLVIRRNNRITLGNPKYYPTQVVIQYVVPSCSLPIKQKKRN